jgi:hypothetical protein
MTRVDAFKRAVDTVVFGILGFGLALCAAYAVGVLL